MPANERDFDEFVVAESPALARLAWAVAGDRESGEDLLQAALVRAWRSWPKVAAADSPERYVRRIMLNTYLTSVRTRRLRERPLRAADDDARADRGYDTVVSRVVLATALRRLPAKQRAVIALRFLEERSEAETAALLGCSRGTVKSHTSRALAALRRTPEMSALTSEQVNR